MRFIHTQDTTIISLKYFATRVSRNGDHTGTPMSMQQHRNASGFFHFLSSVYVYSYWPFFALVLCRFVAFSFRNTDLEILFRCC